jgi:hypothetical protein
LMESIRCNGLKVFMRGVIVVSGELIDVRV